MSFVLYMYMLCTLYKDFIKNPLVLLCLDCQFAICACMHGDICQTSNCYRLFIPHIYIFIDLGKLVNFNDKHICVFDGLWWQL